MKLALFVAIIIFFIVDNYTSAKKNRGIKKKKLHIQRADSSSPHSTRVSSRFISSRTRMTAQGGVKNKRNCDKALKAKKGKQLNWKTKIKTRKKMKNESTDCKKKRWKKIEETVKKNVSAPDSERDIEKYLIEFLTNVTSQINETLFSAGLKSSDNKKSSFALREQAATDQIECSDTASWCVSFASLCEDYEQLRNYCPHTCNVCDQLACADVLSSCDYYARHGYCTGSDYHIQQMRIYCYKSCGFCELKNSKENCGIARLREDGDSVLVVGGKNSERGYYPWQVALYYNNEFLCGGSLISSTKVLTAAHCFNGLSTDSSLTTVTLGEHNRDKTEGSEHTVGVSRIIIHEDYDEENVENDIAILKLVTEVKFSDYINTICQPDHSALLKEGKTCYLSGWGKTFATGSAVNILQHVKLPVADRNTCEKRNTFNNHVVTDKMVCAGFSDGSSFASGCHGDSGGPLQCEFDGKWYLYGIVSWGSPLCNGLDRFTVFTRVTSYKEWIGRQ